MMQSVSKRGVPCKALDILMAAIVLSQALSKGEDAILSGEVMCAHVLSMLLLCPLFRIAKNV